MKARQRLRKSKGHVERKLIKLRVVVLLFGSARSDMAMDFKFNFMLENLPKVLRNTMYLLSHAWIRHYLYGLGLLSCACRQGMGRSMELDFTSSDPLYPANLASCLVSTLRASSITVQRPEASWRSRSQRMIKPEAKASSERTNSGASQHIKPMIPKIKISRARDEYGKSKADV